MTEDVETLLAALKETPRLLKELITEIDPILYKKEIIKGKWSIHEHATHVAVGDMYGFQKRLEDFKQFEFPSIKPLSGDNFPKHFFLELDLFETVEEFFKIRLATIERATALKEEDWHKEAHHPEYKRYTPILCSDTY